MYTVCHFDLFKMTNKNGKKNRLEPFCFFSSSLMIDKEVLKTVFIFTDFSSNLGYMYSTPYTNWDGHEIISE